MFFRAFNLRLRRDTKTFLPEAHTENDLSHIYEGTIWGKSLGSAPARVFDALFLRGD